MNNVKCPLCECYDFKMLYDLSNTKTHKYIGLPGIIKICLNCNMIYKTYEKQESRIYNSGYSNYFFSIKKHPRDNDSFYEELIYKSFQRIQVKTDAPELLDIGSGMGLGLETANRIGYLATGIELSDQLADYSKKKGLNVINSSINEIELNKKFNTITMMDLIEHISDPMGVLIKLKSLLKSDGELIVYTPNHNSLIVKISSILYRIGIKSPVENIFACSHISFFTSDSLFNIISKAGYQIIDIQHYCYNISKPGQEISMITKIGIYLIEKIGKMLGFKGFRVAIYATLLNK